MATKQFAFLDIEKEMEKLLKEHEHQIVQAKIKGFNQGFCLAIAVLLKFDGLVDSNTKDLWKCSPLTKKQIKGYEIDESDKEIIYQYWDELNR